MELVFGLDVLNSTIRLSTPLLLAALAGLYSERAGIVDIGLEGKMLGAAFAAGAAAFTFNSAWAGLFAGVAVSIMLSMLHGFASITARGNQIVSGVAINFVVAGVAILLGQKWFGLGGRTPQLHGVERFREITMPGSEALRDVPVIGWLYSGILSGHAVLVYMAFLAVPVTWWILYRTRFGLRLRALGENPAAVDTAGISVTWGRYRALVVCGLLCGMAGAYLALGLSAGFVKDMTAGKGFIALAALIFAKWKPVNVMFAALLFGYLEALGIRMQGKVLPLIGEVPVTMIQALPYVLTVVLLAGFIGKAIPPKASGIPYVKER